MSKAKNLSEAAAMMGAQSSKKKAQAARENGKLGGRGTTFVSRALARRAKRKAKRAKKV